MWYASSCSGTTITIGVSSSGASRQLEHDSRVRGSRIAASLSSPSRGERDHRAAARLHFLHVADHLLEHVIVRRDRDDRHLLVDQRDRPVLHLAGRIALGVDVRDLLQLERAFERDRVVDAAAEEQEVGARRGSARRSPRSAGASFSVCSSSMRQLQQRVDVRLATPRRQRAAHLAEAQRRAGTARRAAT